MYLAKQTAFSYKRRTIDEFKGIKSGVRKENEFADTLNLCSADYPALSTAPTSYLLDSYASVVAAPHFFLNQGLGYIKRAREDVGSIYSLFYKGKKLHDFVFKEDCCGRNLLNFNGNTLFFGDGHGYELVPVNQSGVPQVNRVGYDIEISATHENPAYGEPSLCLSLMYEDGSEVGNYSSGTADSAFPEDAEIGDCFAKYKEPYRLISKGIQEGEEDDWQPVVSFRLRLELGTGYRFYSVGDYIRLDSLIFWSWAVRSIPSLNRFVRIESVDDAGRYITEPIALFEDYGYILEAKTYPDNNIEGYAYPIINNEGNALRLLGGKLSCCMPEFDYICPGANRVWGCNNSSREIYASELGNARNWSVFEGLAGDSYSVSVGSEGDFTSCCSYLGSPVFFKENEMIVVSGSRPSSFTLNSYSVRGVRRDSPDGVCVVNDVLYYMTYDGVYAYNGSSAYCVSDALGDTLSEMTEAVFGGEGDILYVTGKLDESYVGYSYDTKRDIWHRRSCTQSCGFINYPDATLEATYEDGSAYLRTISDIPSDYPLESCEEEMNGWMWSSGDISYSTPDSKYVRRICLDCECDGASDIYISYDGGEKKEILHLPPHNRHSRRIYLFPQRCQRFCVTCEGTGNMKLYGISIESEEAREDG